MGIGALTEVNPGFAWYVNYDVKLEKGKINNNVFTTGLVVIVSSIINGDPTYAFYSVLPYFVSVVTATDTYPLISVIFQALYGIVTLVAPTSIPLMVTLAYLKVPYKDWLKYIWKILLELVVVAFIIFTILVLI